MKDMRLIVFLLCCLLSASCSTGVSFYSDAGKPNYNSTITGTIRKPDGEGPFPAVILMHGCTGLTKYVNAALSSHSAHLVSNGFVTFIVDSFSGRSKSRGVCGNSSESNQAHEYRQYDAFHALEYLQRQTFVDKNNIFLMGQSSGGGSALSIARFGADSSVFPANPGFRAIAAFYPPCRYIDSNSQFELMSPLIILAGEKDDLTPPFECIQAKEYVSGADYDVVVFENAYHGFNLFIPVQNVGGHTVGGNSAARNSSQEKMLTWFESHMQR